jgi:hypothetical protein
LIYQGISACKLFNPFLQYKIHGADGKKHPERRLETCKLLCIPEKERLERRLISGIELGRSNGRTSIPIPRTVCPPLEI